MITLRNCRIGVAYNIYYAKNYLPVDDTWDRWKTASVISEPIAADRIVQDVKYNLQFRLSVDKWVFNHARVAQDLIERFDSTMLHDLAKEANANLSASSEFNELESGVLLENIIQSPKLLESPKINIVRDSNIECYADDIIITLENQKHIYQLMVRHEMENKFSEEVIKIKLTTDDTWRYRAGAALLNNYADDLHILHRNYLRAFYEIIKSHRNISDKNKFALDVICLKHIDKLFILANK